jgi:hypothetical protein
MTAGLRAQGTGIRFHVARLIRCRLHNEWTCFVQLDGSHVSEFDCNCEKSHFASGVLPLFCRVDAHSIAWLIANPDFTEDAA